MYIFVRFDKKNLEKNRKVLVVYSYRLVVFLIGKI